VQTGIHGATSQDHLDTRLRGYCGHAVMIFLFGLALRNMLKLE